VCPPTDKMISTKKRSRREMEKVREKNSQGAEMAGAEIHARINSRESAQLVPRKE
jgi:hypothetical protein